ncbi:MAG: uroporphyrinogen decarboxylase family protein [Thermoleophilia bacterium]|nr:uroporphyrinogen decarboxylase family protein [Thermoleophilia bacterium]
MSAVPEDRMTPKERVGSLLQGKPIDRVPAVPVLLNGAARVVGYTVKEMVTDGEKVARAHVAAYRKYGSDMITILTATASMAEAMGTRLAYPEENAPYIETPFLLSEDDVDRLHPVDVHRDGRLPVYLEATARCVEEVGEEVFVGTLFAGSFTTAASLYGTAKFVKTLHRNPDFAHRVLRYATDTNRDWIEAIVAAGGVPVNCEPIATGSILGTEMFRRFVVPYLTELQDYVKSFGLPALSHICGRIDSVLDPFVESGPSVISVDVADMGYVSRTYGTRVGLMGNVRPAETVLLGTPESVDQEVKQILDQAGANPCGFVLATGCEVPIDSPPENLLAFVQAARKYGQRERL